MKGLFGGLDAVARGLGFSGTPSVLEEVLRPGLVAVIHVGLLAPQFGAPTRDHLCTPLARTATAKAIVAAADALHRRGAFRDALCARLSIDGSTATREEATCNTAALYRVR